MIRNTILIFFLLSCNILKANDSIKIAKEVWQTINKSKSNKNELIKAAKYYKPSNQLDSLKHEAMNFLIKNMDIHYSQNYYWVDSEGNKIDFNENQYASFQQAIAGLDSIKLIKGKISPKTIIYHDVDTITANYLVNNVEQAFKYWNSPIRGQLSFTDFCEYILPYRVNVEPLQNWRNTYNEKFSWLYDSVLNYQPTNMIKFLMSDINKWFTCIYNFEKRKEPLSRLGSLQVLLRKKGYCEDAANVGIWALRSQGICATTDFIPYWATSTGGHTLNFVKNNNGEAIKFDILFKEEGSFKLIREPGKVIRETYSKQPNTLPTIVDTSLIPRGFLRMQNIIDVTNEYWKTATINIPLANKKSKDSIVFVSVLNGLSWKPVWWSNKIDSGKVKFENMTKGVVYLPFYYKKRKPIPAAYPYALGYNNELLLKPDTAFKRQIVLKNQEHYLLYQANKKYKLYYWDVKWQLLATKVAPQNCEQMVFDKVPLNALLILVPEHSKGKERPFIVTKEGRRVWF